MSTYKLIAFEEQYVILTLGTRGVGNQVLGKQEREVLGSVFLGNQVPGKQVREVLGRILWTVVR